MNIKRILKSPIRLFIAAICLIFCAVAGWEAMFHGPNDTKDLRYQGWRLGIFPFDLDQATSTMIADAHRDDLVIGKTKEELIRKFGYLTPLDQASQYIKYCYFNSPYYGKLVLILRNSEWMVIMKNDRAEELVLVEGC